MGSVISVPIGLDVLAIEVFAFTPHLETTGEICMKYAGEGEKTALVFIDIANPDDIQLPAFYRLLGASAWNKVDDMARELRSAGIDCLRYRPTWKERSVARKSAGSLLAGVRSITDVRTISYRCARLGLGVVSSLISLVRERAPRFEEHKAVVRELLENAILTYNSTQALLTQYTPHRILVFNGRHALSKAITEAARENGKEVLFHERGAHEGLYYLSSHSPHDVAHDRERLHAAYRDASADRDAIGASFFTRRREGEGISWESFIGNQAKGVVPERRKATRWTFYTTSDEEFAATAEYDPHTIFQSQAEAIQWLIAAVSKREDTELIIRLHPAMADASKRDLQWWGSLGSSSVTVIQPESSIDSYSLAESSDLVFTYGSTMGIEAAYIGKPSIAMADALYCGQDCVYEPATVDALATLLQQNSLPPMPRENCLPFGYHVLTFGTAFSRYTPEDLFAGKWCGRELNYDGTVLRNLRRIKRSFVHGEAH